MCDPRLKFYLRKYCSCVGVLQGNQKFGNSAIFGGVSLLTEMNDSNAATFNLPFPIYFVIHTTQGIWAVGHDDHIDLKGYLNASIKKKKSNRKRKAEQSCSTNLTQMRVSSKISFDLKCISFINVDAKKEYILKNNPICFVDEFLDDCLLLCRVNTYHQCWSLQVITYEGKTLFSSNIPFYSDIVNHRFQLSITWKGSDEYSSFHDPILRFVQAEGVTNEWSSCAIKTRNFALFFGRETLSFCRAVILVGAPNGQVLWRPFLSECQDVSKYEFQVLCDIEQPVKDIQICPKIFGQDLILVIGFYGKVMILSSETCDVHRKNASAFTVLISYIPSPVHSHVLLNATIFHVSANGKLWISVLQKNKNECFCKDKVYQSSCTEYYGIKQVSNLIKNRERVLFTTFDGYMYVGELFVEHEPCDNKTIASSDEFPQLLDVGYQISQDLCSLESVELKQKRILSVLTTLTFLNNHGSLRKNMLCCIQETSNNIFCVSFSLSCLKKLNLEPDLCHLTTSITSYFQQKSMNIKKQWLFNTDCDAFLWEIHSSVLPFTSYHTFPWLLEVGLNFDIPEDWKQLLYLRLVERKIPQYFKLTTVVINQFFLLHRKEELVHLSQYVRKETKRNMFLIVKKICNMKSVLKFRTSEIEKEILFPNSLFSSVCQLSNHSAETLSKMTETAMCFEIIKLFANQVDSGEISAAQPLMCLGYDLTLFVSRHKDFLCRFETDNFKLLMNLKFCIMHLLMVSKGETDITIAASILTSENVCLKCEVLSRKINDLLSDDNTLWNTERKRNIYNLYKYLRDEISSKLIL